MTERKRFSLGDTVWLVYAGLLPVTRPCRVCAGTKRVTLVCGDGSHWQLDCEACAKGFDGPRGVESEYEHTAKATPYVVTGIREQQTGEGERVEYLSGAGGCYNVLNAEECYATMDEALAAGDVKIAEANADAERRIAWKVENTNKSYAWNAGYHRRAAAKARKDAEYHERKAVALQAKAKEPVTDG